MNKKQRQRNRQTAKQLKRDVAPPCPNCGERGPHWVSMPYTLLDLLNGAEERGFWTCPMYYGPDGRRLPGV